MAKRAKNLFELVPRQKRPFEECPDGTIDVLSPKYGRGPVASVLKRFLKNTPVRMHLDDIGASVWRLCDGERNVHQIGASLQERFGERIEPVYDRLAMFLEQMRKNGLIEWRP